MIQQKPRRLRNSPIIRKLTSDVNISLSDIIHPIFIIQGENIKNPITTLANHYQLSLDMLDEEIAEICSLGIKAVLLFGISLEKDDQGSAAFDDCGIIQNAIRKIKSIAPELLVITDVCLCSYTSHGHCGVLCPDTVVDNEKSIKILAKQALSHARAGADIVSPSASLDGMVLEIRKILDANSFAHIPIMSYSVKYASSMYGPFRVAAGGSPKFGNRKTYQMNYANSNEALIEAELDVKEGADILMVKPAHTYLDIIYKIKSANKSIPLAAFHTSGEYAMITSAHSLGTLDFNEAIVEVTAAIKRSGADLIITYAAKTLAKLIIKN